MISDPQASGGENLAKNLSVRSSCSESKKMILEH
jgi:hypothetical protein